MIEGRCRAGFGQNPSTAFRLARKFIRKKLDGDGAAQKFVLGAIDLAHPARSNFLKDPIVSELLANHEGNTHKCRHLRHCLSASQTCHAGFADLSQKIFGRD